MSKILKMLIVLSLTVVFSISFSNGASAAKQSSNSSVYLGSYSMANGYKFYSGVCTATQSKMTMRVTPTLRDGQMKVQQYKSSKWSDLTGWNFFESDESFKYSFTPVKGRDYRVIVQKNGILTGKGQVLCE